MPHTTLSSAKPGSQSSKIVPMPAHGDLFHSIVDHIERFAVLPNEHASAVLAVWVVHTHVYDVQASTPRLIITASGKGAGKSILCEVIRPMCSGEEEVETEFGKKEPRYGAIMTADASPAYVIDTIEWANKNRKLVTVIQDEADVEGTPGADIVALRKTINSGYRPSGSAGRVLGGKRVRRSTYAPFVIAGIKGNIHETTLSRSIVIHMRPATREDKYEGYEAHIHDVLGEALRRRIQEWVMQVRPAIRAVDPDMPDVFNRDREVWRPLIQIADLAGSPWDKRLRDAMYFWLGGGTRRQARTLADEVLEKAVAVFDFWDNPKTLPTAMLVEQMRLEGFPDMTPARLADLLRGHSVHVGLANDPDPDSRGRRVKGYRLKDLQAALDRVLYG